MFLQTRFGFIKRIEIYLRVFMLEVIEFFISCWIEKLFYSKKKSVSFKYYNKLLSIDERSSTHYANENIILRVLISEFLYHLIAWFFFCRNLSSKVAWFHSSIKNRFEFNDILIIYIYSIYIDILNEIHRLFFARLSHRRKYSNFLPFEKLWFRNTFYLFEYFSVLKAKK
jgi:hypothetical protein